VGSCETVQTSRWSELLGLPVAAWGLGAYVALLALALVGLQPRYADARAVSWALVGISGWSVLFSGWLTYLELFVIHAICMYCVASALLVTIIFAASLADLRGRRPADGMESAEEAGEGRWSAPADDGAEVATGRPTRPVVPSPR
jgi:uncharacterized membrane protein